MIDKTGKNDLHAETFFSFAKIQKIVVDFWPIFSNILDWIFCTLLIFVYFILRNILIRVNQSQEANIKTTSRKQL